MGANLQFKCPIEGCQYVAGFRLGMGQEEDPAEHAARFEILRDEHPAHPITVAKWTIKFA